MKTCRVCSVEYYPRIVAGNHRSNIKFSNAVYYGLACQICPSIKYIDKLIENPKMHISAKKITTIRIPYVLHAPLVRHGLACACGEH